jgi:hypothetical protein
MPRSKNWKNSKAKKGNSFRDRYKQTDQTGNPGNFKLRSTDMDFVLDIECKDIPAQISRLFSTEFTRTVLAFVSSKFPGKFSDKVSENVSSILRSRAPIVDSQSRQSQYDASKLISKNDSSLHCNPFDAIFLKFGTFDQYDMRLSMLVNLPSVLSFSTVFLYI